MSWGLECRVPFLDKGFLDIAMTLDPKAKICGLGIIEKHVLRKAFDTPDRPYLPDSILWRQKEQFSDGVGYGWIDSLRNHAASLVSDAEMQNAHIRFPHDTPANKEAYYYRGLFEKHFPQPSCLQTVSRWVPRQDWGCPSDPSGRAQKVHTESYEKAGVAVPNAVV
jgi:asparagine synthase (glutamine-hydrolysing)